jgi:hypothetical protein
MDNIINKIYNRIISEAKNIKPKDLNPKLKKFIEDKYGPMDDKDFFSDDLDTYFKTDTSYESEGGGISHNIIKLPSFNELAIQLKKTRDLANELVRGEVVRDDDILRGIYDQQREVFNKFRTHLRKEYPAFYDQLKQQLTEEDIDEMSTTGGGAGAASFTPGTGAQYATPYAFRKKGQKPNVKSYEEFGYKLVKEDIGATLGPGPKASEDGVKDNSYVKQFGYKLVPKKIKGSDLEIKQLFESPSVEQYQKERINAFDSIEQELNDIYKMLSNAKNETSDYYNDNPSSYSVVKPTDLVLDYIKDIKDLLKGE